VNAGAGELHREAVRDRELRIVQSGFEV